MCGVSRAFSHFQQKGCNGKSHTNRHQQQHRLNGIIINPFVYTGCRHCSGSDNSYADSDSHTDAGSRRANPVWQPMCILSRTSGNVQQSGSNGKPHPDGNQQQHRLDGVTVSPYFDTGCRYCIRPDDSNTIANTCSRLRQLPRDPAGNGPPFQAPE